VQPRRQACTLTQSLYRSRISQFRSSRGTLSRYVTGKRSCSNPALLVLISPRCICLCSKELEIHITILSVSDSLTVGRWFADQRLLPIPMGNVDMHPTWRSPPLSANAENSHPFIRGCYGTAGCTRHTKIAFRGRYNCYKYLIILFGESTC
jgi:hypothetical protein